MGATVYIEMEEKNDHIRFVNDTGAGVVQYELSIVGPYVGVADAIIASAAVGSWHVEEGIILQVAETEMKTGELTFATPGQEVYFDATTLEFSDTETAGYYLVGYLNTAKDSNGTIRFEKLRYWTLITT